MSDVPVLVSDQRQSPLWRIPQEIRDLIYKSLFLSISLSRDPDPQAGEPVSNSLAIRYVCRRVKLEIGNKWLNYPLFIFHNMEKMRSRLLMLPIDLRREIRFVRVLLTESMGLGPRLGIKQEKTLSEILEQLPGLRLQRLTIVEELGPYPLVEGVSKWS
ncbi:hypothetical protein QBC46DRAFT_418655 [Diplogelasinospora grovesii]|uniref:Uncharacterized protein n=1 Tax=Diplogelasinospora grovesii TaxID=303347 RepID=A0AAN6MZV2_9PEZI|nr:hypothetical protein QBC46DRAFT_418655 [Diplogelasinospora grovesii]